MNCTGFGYVAGVSSARFLAAASLLGICLFVASGRTVAFDSRSELTQAVHFCSTGHIAARHKLSGDFVPKDFKSNAHVWYDANDIGGTLIMLPAACASTALGARNPGHPSGLTTLAKSGASLTFAIVGGIGAIFVFLTLARLIGDRRAWWWSVALLFTTAYLAYVKGVWNVMPAAAAIAGLMYVVSRQFPEGTLPSFGAGRAPPAVAIGNPGKLLCGAAVAIGLASLCRYSLLPFIFAGSVLALIPTIRRASRTQILCALGLLLLVVAPDFWFNALRTGHFWVPAEAAPQWQPIALTSQYLLSTPDMFFGIQRGLLFYAPLCLLGYFAAFVIGVRSRGWARVAWLGAIGAAVAYAATVVLLHNWYVYGWGPRYLVPIMPLLFVAAVIACEARAIPRIVAYVAAGLGLLTEIPVPFTNWHALLAVVGVQHRAPDGLVGLWQSFLHGLNSGFSFGGTKSQRALQVPDTWWWHAVGTHPPYIVGVIVAIVGLAALLTLGARRVGQTPATQPQ
jgi:hypothetical protein